MKRAIQLFFILLAIVMVVNSCKKDSNKPDNNQNTENPGNGTEDSENGDSTEQSIDNAILKIKSSDTIFNVSFEDTTFKVHGDANISYQANSKANWIRLLLNDDDNTLITIAVDKNSNFESRTAKIIITPKIDSININRVIKVIQDGKVRFIRTTTKDSIYHVGNDMFNLAFMIEIESNIPFTTSIPAWLTEMDKKINNDSSFTKTTYTFKASSANTSRDGIIQFVGENDITKHMSITIKQPKTKIPNTNLPVADLFDISFIPEGDSAIDYSPYHNKIIRGSHLESTFPKVSYDNSIKMYAATFDRDAWSYYKLSYINKTSFIDDLSNEFTLQIYFKTTNTNDSYTVLGSMQGSGFGLQDFSKNGAGALVYYLTTEDQDNWPNAGTLIPNENTYYDIVITYDGQKLKYYVDGNLNNQIDLTGRIKLPGPKSNHIIFIGSDVSGTATSSLESLAGDIAFLRLYKDAKTASQVQDMDNIIHKRASLTRVGDLKYILENDIPSKLLDTNSSIEKQELKALKYKGWALMGNIETTDQEITNYINEVNKH